MWIGTENGLYSYQNGAIVEEKEINNQLEDKMIYGILRDKEGKLWVGTFGKGIFIFDNNNRLIANLVKDNGFISNAVNHLYMDTKGRVWAATRGGLVHFENTAEITHHEVYNEKQGLENSFVRAIQEDGEGNIWVSTNTGISLWDGMGFSNYNHQDGAPIGDFTNAAACSREDGILFLVRSTGSVTLTR